MQRKYNLIWWCSNYIPVDRITKELRTRDGYDGFLVNLRDVNALRDRMEILAEDKKLREKMGKRARKTAEKLSLDLIVTKVLTVYEKAKNTSAQADKVSKDWEK